MSVRREQSTGAGSSARRARALLCGNTPVEKMPRAAALSTEDVRLIAKSTQFTWNMLFVAIAAIKAVNIKKTPDPREEGPALIHNVFAT